MKAQDVFYGKTRSGWTLRLLAYIAIIVTAALALQFLSQFVL